MAYRSSTASTASSSSTLSTSVPSGVQAGDIVLLLVGYDDVAGTVTSWPTGFEAFSGASDVNLSNDGHSVALAWKRLTEADAGSYSVTLSVTPIDGIIIAAAWSGRHLTDPPVTTVASSSAANASPVSVAATGLTAAAGDDLAFMASSDCNMNTTAHAWSPPSGMTEAQDVVANQWSSGTAAYQDAVSAGATGDKTGTLTLTGVGATAGWAAFLIRLPAAAAEENIRMIWQM